MIIIKNKDNKKKPEFFMLLAIISDPASPNPRASSVPILTMAF